ncbi:hypothetical protein HMPREF3160_06280 [Arthrobacter sp. HMSC06H05]|uniref:peptidyl-tRNA hydrolase n=1 Tax=Pseudoglutamicibacter albus TaxID=98671 RepID=A0ABU1YXH3_9MICC|nr:MULTISPECIES: peptidyl-tRNA hydrolase [Micrococcaceae]MDR7293062.1 hypothetical protein [Pseudoglutamicibacter albus]OFT41946.1 hypothetical protein HMPREF3160_06280 [Arthrobacter sp. HMSC06H05]
MPAVELIQPIAVLKDPEALATHEDTCLAAALASITAWLAFPDDPMWGPWLHGPDGRGGGQGKSVRRGKPKDFRALENAGAVMVSVGTAQAAALAPTEYPLTGRMKQLQVSGTEFEHAGEPTVYGEMNSPKILHIGIDTVLGMSTGKAAAQSAHAGLTWAMQLSHDELEDWIEDGFPSTLIPLDRDGWRTTATNATVVIRDAGHTEITPGSVTAVAW